MRSTATRCSCKLTEVNYPTLRDTLSFVPASAREVVEAAGRDIKIRAVGTGPYHLKEWKRGSRLVLEANPNYREASFPASDDPKYAALEQQHERARTFRRSARSRSRSWMKTCRGCSNSSAARST